MIFAKLPLATIIVPSCSLSVILILEIMPQFTSFGRVTRFSKMCIRDRGYGHIWTGHHKQNSERISEIADFSLFGVSAPFWGAEIAFYQPPFKIRILQLCICNYTYFAISCQLVLQLIKKYFCPVSYTHLLNFT